MKTMTLLTAVVWLTGATASASNHRSLTFDRNHFDEPISFTERGITFYIFTDGGFGSEKARFFHSGFLKAHHLVIFFQQNGKAAVWIGYNN